MVLGHFPSTIVSEGFKGGTRGASIMPRDAVSRAANVERNGGHKWVKTLTFFSLRRPSLIRPRLFQSRFFSNIFQNPGYLKKTSLFIEMVLS